MIETLNIEKPTEDLSLKKSKNWFEDLLEKTTDRQLLYAYSLAFASLFSQQAEAMPVVDKTSPEALAHVDTMTKERFGVSFSDACKKAGCKMIIQNPSENGKYLVHMSQVHAVPNDNAVYALEFKDYLSSMQNVVDSQKVIYSFLSTLQNPTIVQEGYESTESIETYKYRLTPNHVLDVSYLKNIYGDIKASIDNGEETSFFIGDRELYNYRISSDSRFSSMPRLDDSYDLGKADDAFKYKIGDTYKPIRFTLPFDNDEDKLLYSHGALAKLLLEGKDTAILPGDTFTHSEDNAKMIAANNRYATAEYYNNRENFAIAQALGSGDNMPFIVYGASHNFAPNMSKIANGYGVIRIETSISNPGTILEEVEEVDKK